MVYAYGDLLLNTQMKNSFYVFYERVAYSRVRSSPDELELKSWIRVG
jgi:hypothetical protein